MFQLRRRKTFRSQANEKQIEGIVKSYDSELKLNFQPNEGFYYLSRPVRNFSEQDAVEMLRVETGSSMYSDAAKNRHVVVCWPIPVGMVEDFDVCIRNLMKHLKTNDMKRMGSSKPERIRAAENSMDDYKNLADQRKFSFQDNVRACGREYWRDHVRAHAFFDLRGVN